MYIYIGVFHEMESWLLCSIDTLRGFYAKYIMMKAFESSDPKLESVGLSSKKDETITEGTISEAPPCHGSVVRGYVTYDNIGLPYSQINQYL